MVIFIVSIVGSKKKILRQQQSLAATPLRSNRTPTPTRTIFGRATSTTSSTMASSSHSHPKSSIATTTTTLSSRTSTSTTATATTTAATSKTNLLLKEHIKQRNVRRKSSTMHTGGCFASTSSCSGGNGGNSGAMMDEILNKAAKRGSIHYLDSDPKYIRARLLKIQQKQQQFSTAAHSHLPTYGVIGVRKKAIVVDSSSIISDQFGEDEDDVGLSSADIDLPSISHAISSLVSPISNYSNSSPIYY